MFVEDHVEFTGLSGKTYTFEVYPKSAQLPETGGIFIVTYMHPRGHRAGFKVNALHVGVADNLHAAVHALKTEEMLLKKCWNYTCIMNLDTPVTRDAYCADLNAHLSLEKERGD
ncbi:hypothetical protein [Desulfogranum marinum]|uniref:hypothetical protein n=1 Tax=Desulfogranum marinum TaxID=453220 RepID=UPI001963FBAA|nr:hypothetical protein [Desulfogranum marinum]MBM9513649.1 hypothetical protein [Desulfogranum marinum]